MTLYKNYKSIVDSSILDESVFFLGKKAISGLLVIILLSGPFASILPLAILSLNPHIGDHRVRMALNWASVIKCVISGNWLWVFIVTFIEVLRIMFRYIIPLTIRALTKKVKRNARSETFFKKLVKQVMVAKRQNAATNLSQLFSSITRFVSKDESEPFAEEEFQKFKKFFLEFENSIFILNKTSKSLTMFFPTFIFRVSNKGFLLTSDNTMKLIKEPSKEDEICAICREKIGDVKIKLICSHTYCTNCIFTWLNQEQKCPICRNEI